MVIQQNSRKLVMMDILMSETRWVHKKWNKIASDMKLVFYSSTILRDVPTIPDQAPNANYNIPVSLWLVEEKNRVTISEVAEINK